MKFNILPAASLNRQSACAVQSSLPEQPSLVTPPGGIVFGLEGLQHASSGRLHKAFPAFPSPHWKIRKGLVQLAGRRTLEAFSS
jgi:hypothetical protein